jgi:hypothetical protein
VSPVVTDIITKIKELHELAKNPITLSVRYLTSGSSSNYWGGSSSSLLNLDANLHLDSLNLTGYATGTDYVPRTGPYILHQGEAVVTADQNKAGRGDVIINGDMNFILPASAAPNKPEDWRMITRNYIVPELKKLNS